MDCYMVGPKGNQNAIIVYVYLYLRLLARAAEAEVVDTWTFESLLRTSWEACNTDLSNQHGFMNIIGFMISLEVNTVLA